VPVYKNNRLAVLDIEAIHNYRASTVESRRIQPGALFVAHSGAIPPAWLAPGGNPLEGPSPWVTLVSETPTDEELQQLSGS
jgi:hypothetical protein